MTINEYLKNWDPLDFISEGAPDDEYDAEAQAIRERVLASDSEDEIARKVHAIFIEYFEVDPDGLLLDCRQRASIIRDILFNE